MNRGNNRGPASGAVGVFGCGGGGSEDNGASGGGGGYSGGGGVVVPVGNKPEVKEALYCNGEDCSGLAGGNSNDDGLVQIIELFGSFQNVS